MRFPLRPWWPIEEVGRRGPHVNDFISTAGLDSPLVSANRYWRVELFAPEKISGIFVFFSTKLHLVHFITKTRQMQIV